MSARPAVTEDGVLDASGNLLTNDGGDGPLVAQMASQSVPATGSIQIAGSYGLLTIAADGAWSYALDNANAAVNALDDGQTLTESFD